MTPDDPRMMPTYEDVARHQAAWPVNYSDEPSEEGGLWLLREASDTPRPPRFVVLRAGVPGDTYLDRGEPNALPHLHGGKLTLPPSKVVVDPMVLSNVVVDPMVLYRPLTLGRGAWYNRPLIPTTADCYVACSRAGYPIDLTTEIGQIANFLRVALPEYARRGERHLNEGGGNRPGPTYWAIDALTRDFQSAEDELRARVNADFDKQSLQGIASRTGVSSMTVDLRKALGDKAPGGTQRHATFALTTEGKWQAPLPALPSFDSLDDAYAAVVRFWQSPMGEGE